MQNNQDFKKAQTRAKQIVSQMSVEELAAQVLALPADRFPEEELAIWATRGVGVFLNSFGEQAGWLQEIVLKNGKVPFMSFVDAPHGHGLNKQATIFPCVHAIACSHNRKLAQQIAQATGAELRADNFRGNYHPSADIILGIIDGRVDEKAGTEPYLCAEMAKFYIMGYQGTNLSPESMVVSVAKHFVAPYLTGQDGVDSDVSLHRLRSEFFPPFKAAIDAGCMGVMTAFNSVSGVSMSTNKELIGLLRKELKFKGFITSDWDPITEMVTRQRVAETKEEAVRLCMEAGMNMIMSAPESYEIIIDLVKTGKLSLDHVKASAEIILTVKILSGLVDDPYGEARNHNAMGCQDHHDLALEAARESVVLLKNADRILPIKDGIKNILVIGEAADSFHVIEGDWRHDLQLATDQLNPVLDQVELRPHVTLRQGMEELCRQRRINLSYAQGYNLLGSTGKSLLNKAIELARTADLIVFAAGDFPFLHYGEGRDNAKAALPGDQEEIFEEIRRTGKPVVGVSMTSKPYCTAMASESDAFIFAPPGGLHSGKAIAEILFGDYNPNGKLAAPWARHVGQNYQFSLGDAAFTWRTREAPKGRGYVDGLDTPLFPLGFGLSYTEFQYNGLQAIVKDNSVVVQINVANVGNMPGEEIAQVYFEDVVSSVITRRRMIGFEKISLCQGEMKAVEFKFNRSDFSLVNAEGRRVVEPGQFNIFAGASSQDSDLQRIQITL